MYELEYQNYKSKLSKNIKRYRKQMGFAQEKLALESGVDRTFVSKIEREIGNPSLEILIRLSVTLKIGLTDLFS